MSPHETNREQQTSRVEPFKTEEGLSTSSTAWLNDGNATDGASTWKNVCTLLDFLNHALILIVTIFLLYHSLRTISTLNLHVALCTVGYVLLMAEAIVVLAGGNLPTKSLSRRAKSHVHWILQLLGLCFTLAGVFLLYQTKTRHFKSTHAIIGITSVAIMIFLAVFGYPVLAAVKLRKLIRPVIVKFFHNFLGTSCFVIGITAQCYGYKKSWLTNVTGGMENIQLTCIVLTSLIAILSLRSALPQLGRQFVALFK